MPPAVFIAESARKHGVTDEDMLHAFRNTTRAFDIGDGFTMLIGPRRDGSLIEIGVIAADDGTVIVHAFHPARVRFLPKR